MRGSIVWRCYKCRINSTKKTCRCPGGKYCLVIQDGQRQRWIPVSRSKKDAEKKLAEILNECHSGTFKTITQIRFKDFADQWLRDYAKPRIKISTYRSYEGLLKKHAKPFFGEQLLTQIEAKDIERFLSAVRQTTFRKRKLSPRTANYLLILLKTMLKHARKWNMIRESPADGIQRMKEERHEMDYLTPDEIQALLKAADEPYRTLFATAVLTGMRRGELLGLQWGDIDWRRNLIHVRRSLYWRLNSEKPEKHEEPRWIFSSPKSRGSVRTVIMSPKLREILEIHRIKGAVSPQDLVFCDKNGNPIDPDNMVRLEFHTALTRAGLRKVRFHDLRHTHTTLLIAQGAHAKFIQGQLGHASIQTTLDEYGHLMPGIDVEAGLKLDEQIFVKNSSATQNGTLRECRV